MRGSRRENIKNAAIAMLIGVIFAQNICTGAVWRDIGLGYIMAEIVWVLLICYDEIQRKRRETMWRYKKKMEM